MSLFVKLFSPLFAKVPAPGPKSDGNKNLAQTEKEFEVLMQRAQEQLREFHDPDRVRQNNDDRRKEEREQLAGEWHRRARNSVEHLHGELGTGLAEELDRLSRLMIGHAWKPDPTAYLEERIEQSVLQKIYWETGLMAWEELLRLMADRGVAWPTPAGLSPHATDDERDTATEYARAQSRQGFLQYPPCALGDLVLGKVKVWSSVYPAVDSPLWRDLCLTAVAAALRIQWFAIALEGWLWRPRELELHLVGMLEKELASLREHMASGIHTLAEADAVSQRTCQICEDLLPGEVWHWLEPHLSRIKRMPAAGAEDPVCGMRFPVSRALESHNHQGRTVWFCCKGCKEKFLKSPELFTPNSEEALGR